MKPNLQRVILLTTQLAINALALVVVDAIFAGIWFEHWQAMVAAAVLLGLVNTYLRPLIVLLTLPLNIITLGLFTIIINAGLLFFVSWLIPPFHVNNFRIALGGSLVISLISFLLNLFLQPGRGCFHIQIHRG